MASFLKDIDSNNSFLIQSEPINEQKPQYFAFIALISVLLFFLVINIANIVEIKEKEAKSYPPIKTEFLSHQMYTPVIAFTFDDGPKEEITLKLIEALNERDAKATFFVLGIQAEENPQIIQAAYDSGHQIGNHSYDHPRFTKIDFEKIKYQINKTINIITEITGETPQYVRPPYGSVNQKVILQIGWPLINWTMDPRDWESQDADIVYQHIMSNIENGSVIVLHDKLPSTHEAVLRVIDELQPKGWKFVTLEDYYSYFEIEPKAHNLYCGTETL